MFGVNGTGKKLCTFFWRDFAFAYVSVKVNVALGSCTLFCVTTEQETQTMKVDVGALSETITGWTVDLKVRPMHTKRTRIRKAKAISLEGDVAILFSCSE